MNLLVGRIVATAGGSTFRPDGADAGIVLPAALAASVQADRRVVLGIRPEELGLPSANGAGLCIVELAKLAVEPTGADSHVIFRLGHQRLTGRFKPGDVPIGETPPVAFDLSRASLFDADSGRRL